MFEMSSYVHQHQENEPAALRDLTFAIRLAEQHFFEADEQVQQQQSKTDLTRKEERTLRRLNHHLERARRHVATLHIRIGQLLASHQQSEEAEDHFQQAKQLGMDHEEFDQPIPSLRNSIEVYFPHEPPFLTPVATFIYSWAITSKRCVTWKPPPIRL